MLRRTTLDRPLELLLTTRARQALDLAEQEARALRLARVTADHLLKGLARLGEGVAVMALSGLGRDLTVTRAQETGADLDHVVEQARREAAGLGHRYIGTEHLLLGLLHEESMAAALGVDLPRTRAQVIRVLQGKAR
ncbi:Clp protease N-terminal domain-containing protein [Nonomuraea roseoviolacea]|uniref:ATP-dependent Clp protease ATP-binding subunit ClpA n=1 Tax=Nonomuraea roseoviolacea subsp. carminata TaxID=160689 RepID=A0ABT1KFB6_9ACTN|nr:Clp protease N-terminal domain-containing protein [Nonomuraea roseoviolacea]MCP2351634.1 ATP-dependent Clp protease ATP-binding subunit ClpA [Nonomuraea roseoviolacea subsp. carminata]